MLPRIMALACRGRVTVKEELGGVKGDKAYHDTPGAPASATDTTCTELGLAVVVQLEVTSGGGSFWDLI